MIDPLVRALQAAAAGPPARWLRVTVATTSPLRVVLPGGTVVAGLAVTGLTYTSGQAAYALYQEPAIGPILPVS